MQTLQHLRLVNLCLLTASLLTASLLSCAQGLDAPAKRKDASTAGDGGSSPLLDALQLEEVPPLDSGSLIDIGSPPLGSWVDLPAGVFQMGSPSSENCRYVDETAHQVTLTHGLKISATETTQAQFSQRLGYNPSQSSGCGDNCPVEQVSWHEAAAYCNKLSELTALNSCYSCSGTGHNTSCSIKTAYQGQLFYACPGYRLPTEAEWEYAYRATVGAALYNNHELSDCNSDTVNAGAIGWGVFNSSNSPHPAASKNPNGWGLYDMAGNVWEWTNDWYAADYGATSVVDPVGPGTGSDKVRRGGSYELAPQDFRAARRNYHPADSYWGDIGFRCVKTN